jgi:hypothetical protein
MLPNRNIDALEQVLWRRVMEAACQTQECNGLRKGVMI